MELTWLATYLGLRIFIRGDRSRTGIRLPVNISVTLIHSRPPSCFYTYFYNEAHRLRLETLKTLIYRTFWKFQRIFKPLLDTGGGFTSETAVRRFKK
jgi:hypothetical protein